MNTSGALAVLAELRGELPCVSSEIGARGDAAFLRLWSSTDSGRWAVVSSPGDRWFSIEVSGGYSLDHFEEGTPDAEVRVVLRRDVALAWEYVRGNAQPTGLRWRRSVLRLHVAGREYYLRRSLSYELKRALGLRPQRDARRQS